VSIEGPAKADIVKKEVHNGVLTVDYLPVIPGEYLVSVKSRGKDIQGSPFSARISGFAVYVLREILTIKIIRFTHLLHVNGKECSCSSDSSRLCCLLAVKTVNATLFCVAIQSSDFVNFCTVF